MHNEELWTTQVQKYMEGESCKKDIRHWARVDESLPFLKNFRGPDNAGWRSQCSLIGKDCTVALLHSACSASGTTPKELLLTAVGFAYQSLLRQEQCCIHVEDSSRPTCFAADYSQTVGYFTRIVPVPLQLMEADELGRTIRAAKESLRQAPGAGIGDRVRWLNNGKEGVPRLRTLMRARGFSVAIADEPGSIADGSESLAGAPGEITIHTGEYRRSETYSEFALVVSFSAEAGAIACNLEYKERVFGEKEINAFAADCCRWTEQIISYCLGLSVAEASPSDYGQQELSIEDLDIINNLFK
jgi:hypothetical protein